MENIPLISTKEKELDTIDIVGEKTDPVTSVSEVSTRVCGPELECGTRYKLGKEIQRQPTLEGNLSHYEMFHGYMILNPHDGEKVETGLRVVRKVSKTKDLKAGDLGTIFDVNRNGEIEIQWDRHDELESFGTDKYNQYALLLFDNAQADVEHDDSTCDGCKQDPLLGIRWKCLTCLDYDLCTKCYISDQHNVDHIFQRIVSPNLKSVEMPPRRIKKIFGGHDTRGKQIGSGILKFSEVQLRGNTTESKTKTGIVEKYNDNRRSVSVKWNALIDVTEHEKKITELKLKHGGNFSYYPEHLPVLVQNSDFFIEVDVNELESTNTKIEVIIWRNIQKKKRTFTPTLYLIFDNQCKDDKHRQAFMAEVIDFAIKTKLPCHIKEQKVLFHSGSRDSACIHYRTDKDTVEQLICRGFRIFERGDILSSETEINYFLRMAEYAIGEDVLPVIISLRNGATKVQGIPIIQLKKNTQNVCVVWPMNNGKTKKTEHTTIKPWNATTKQSNQSEDLEMNDSKNNQQKDDIDFISDIRSDELDTLICYLIIGGCLKDEDLPGREDGHDYLTALSVYLLKKEKWQIPKQHIGKTFDQKSLEYIHEQDMTADVFEKLWYNQMSFYKMEYKPPKYQHVTDSEVNREGNKGNRIDITKWSSECYGLIFFALLQKQYWSGATQLVEKGYIRIHHLLLGCVILEDETNSWKTTVLQKEKLQRLKSAFTETAICITNCIYDADKKTEDAATVGKRVGSKEEQKQPSNKDVKELDDCINHAERLLLNHGYLTDAIMTKNNTFLENDTVKKILNKKWYGTEKINCNSIFSLTILAAIHLLVLPILMVNMEARPFLWLYKKYKLPFLKVLIHMLGFLVLLIAYACMLLFDYSDDGITKSDWFIIAWIISFVVDEIKQVTVAIIRGKIKRYATDKWNILDWLFIMIYTIGMLLRVWEGSGFRISSKCLLVAAFMFLCTRMLNLCCMTQFLGPKLVIIKRMIKDTIAFMIVMTVIMVWYSVSLYALLYPNSEFSWTQIENILSNGYWVLFGELNLYDETLMVPYCTFNMTEYRSGALPQCPTQLGLYIAPYLTAFYGLIAVVLLLNLLIAIYSDSYNEVQQKSELHWRQIQNAFLEEYSLKTVFPIHLQLVALPGIIFAMLTLCYYYLNGTLLNKEEKINNRPMVVRVFLYNTNYDLRLKSTDDAEENGVVEAKGKVDHAEFDSITEELDCNSISNNMQNQSDDSLKTQILERLRNIEIRDAGISNDLEEIKNMLAIKAISNPVAVDTLENNI